jgi:ubiquinone/menaquinone biosynthesis C-methylase UbiE
MTPEHVALCASAEWRELVERLLPWVLEGRQLGDEVLEVGAGPGMVTDHLRRRAPRVVAVELDERLAAALGRRLAGGNVEVVAADASALPFRDARFSAVACFTMLHHVPSLAAQDRMLAELRRVLRPGGVLVGTDGTDTPARRDLHRGDVFLPVPPEELPGRLAAAGFAEPVVDQRDDRIRFAGVAPEQASS